MKTISLTSLPTINLVWDVYRGITNVKESFSASQLWVWLVGANNKWPLSVSINGEGSITATLPSNLQAGVYSAYAIWTKSPDPKTTLAQICESDKRCRTDVQNILCLSSANDAEVWSGSTLTIKIKSSVATYGYDGLGAYEYACMHGNSGGYSETEWYDKMFNSATQASDSATSADESAEEAKGYAEQAYDYKVDAETASTTLSPRVTALEGKWGNDGHALIVGEDIGTIYDSANDVTMDDYIEGKLEDVILAIKEIHGIVDTLLDEPNDWQYYND